MPERFEKGVWKVIDAVFTVMAMNVWRVSVCCNRCDNRNLTISMWQMQFGKYNVKNIIRQVQCNQYNVTNSM